MKKILPFLLTILFLLDLTGCTNPNIDSSASLASGIAEQPGLSQKTNSLYQINGSQLTYQNQSYEILSVEGGDLSGTRKPNVAVDIGYGDRVYWGLTNEYSQLVYVLALSITLQDPTTEEVNQDGRYYNQEAAVPGTEEACLDQGHVIADSLGGVSNAYNITPQNSELNRHGDQAYMEKIIRDANGCEDFVATISYADHSTQIPCHYHYTYELLGESITDDFDNDNPGTSSTTASMESSDSIRSIDTNQDGQISIQEAKDAGYSMPITSDSWLYPYMRDGDKDGLVGE